MGRTPGARRLLRGATVVAALLLSWAAAAYDYHVYGDGVQLACLQMERSRLVCDFRRFAPPEPEQVTARMAGRQLPAPRVTPYAAEPGTTAAMFLVDVSDAELPVAPVAAREHVAALLDAAPAHQHYGLASFANEVELHAPLAPGTDRIRNVLGELTPATFTTTWWTRRASTGWPSSASVSSRAPPCRRPWSGCAVLPRRPAACT
jgi:hypothetical protein